MTRMLDAWHERYHGDAVDYQCPYCQDEMMRPAEQLPLPVVEIEADIEWGTWLEETYDPDNGTIDRLEDLEVA